MTGWGPDRPVYTDTTYPVSLTFNSTYENQDLGDERNWVRARPADDAESIFADRVEITGGEKYVINAYLRLDGPSDQVAEDPRLLFMLPVCTGHRVTVSGFVRAGNVFPREIYDGVEFWSREDFNLALVPDSAVIISNYDPDPGRPVSTLDLVTATGVDVASGHPDGQLRPGYSEALYLQFRVRAQTGPTEMSAATEN